MSRNQYIALAAVLGNLVLVLLFPPVDQFSIAASKLPIFAGFHFAFAIPPNGHINTNLLWLEVSAILINAGIAWLLLHPRQQIGSRRYVGIQNAILIFTGVNLLLAVLFPPFESVFAVTNAALPNFEGFYFIFNQKPSHVIVTTLLHLEAFFILFNGAVLWLLFLDRSHIKLTPAQKQALLEQLRGGGK